MFADDTNITFAASMLTDLKNGLNSELISLNLYLNSNEAKSANLQLNKRILNWQPFWNKVY